MTHYWAPIDVEVSYFPLMKSNAKMTKEFELGGCTDHYHQLG